MAPEVYHGLMDRGFRRSGNVFYQPACAGCRDCLPIRVPVEQFRPSKSQRRCLRRNIDLRVSVGDPEPTSEKFELYQRYLRNWHQREDTNEIESQRQFEDFLYKSPVRTIECCYRNNAGSLLAVGICDLSERSLSSVYFYFDPAESNRSLGTFGALHELDYAKSAGIPFYYLGYLLYDCGSMAYKAYFRPYQILGTDGAWRNHAE